LARRESAPRREAGRRSAAVGPYGPMLGRGGWGNIKGGRACGAVCWLIGSEFERSFEPMRPYDERLDHLLTQAARVFAEKGYHPTPMRALAGARRMSLAGMYYYVRGKEALLFLSQERCFTRVLEGASRALAAARGAASATAPPVSASRGGSRVSPAAVSAAAMSGRAGAARCREGGRHGYDEGPPRENAGRVSRRGRPRDARARRSPGEHLDLRDDA